MARVGGRQRASGAARCLACAAQAKDLTPSREDVAWFPAGMLGRTGTLVPFFSLRCAGAFVEKEHHYDHTHPEGVTPGCEALSQPSNRCQPGNISGRTLFERPPKDQDQRTSNVRVHRPPTPMQNRPNYPATAKQPRARDRMIAHAKIVCSAAQGRKTPPRQSGTGHRCPGAEETIWHRALATGADTSPPPRAPSGRRR